MDGDGSYRLVGPRDGSLVLVVLMPILCAAWIALERDAPLWHLRPVEFPYAIGAIAAIGVGFSTYVALHRRRARSERLTVDATGVSLRAGSRPRWHVDWADLDAVVSRRYTLQIRYFSRALLFRTKGGRTWVVPTASALYGRMPELEMLVARLHEARIPVESDYWPSWMSPM